MKTHTDKERLDWLTRHKADLKERVGEGWTVLAKGTWLGTSPRNAIDIAMNASANIVHEHEYRQIDRTEADAWGEFYVTLQCSCGVVTKHRRYNP